MRRSWIVCCLVALAAAPVFAAGLGLKAGLWEVRLVKQVVDGRDTAAQMAASLERMQQAMANLPPDQRARMEAMLKQNGMSQGSNGAFRICVSPEMAKRDSPILDREGRCQPATVTHGGNQTTFEISCTTNGVAMTGKGEATSIGNMITTRTDVTTHGAGGATHVMQSESQMTYLGSDCGDVHAPQLR